MTPDQCADVARTVQGLFNNPKYSDLIVKCNSKEWRVHKNIVCTQSGFFEAACKVEWQQSRGNRVIDLNVEEEEIIGAMMEFFYSAGLPEARSNSIFGPLRFEFEVFKAADKYDIPKLAHLAMANFHALLNPLKIEHRSNFLKVIPAVYQEVPLGIDLCCMRRNLLAAAQQGLSTVLTLSVDYHPGSEHAGNILKVAQEVPAFGADLLMRSSFAQRSLEAKVKELELGGKEKN